MVKLYLCLLLATANFFALIDGKTSTLELVHVLFRHGDRTPDRHVIYPKDPHINETYYPFGFGQLTNAGKRKQYLLGKALHKRYKKFLGTYTLNTIDARSTDYNRTKMSLQLVLASLFPPEKELIWEKNLHWQPIPFNYFHLDDDYVLGDPFKNCKRYKNSYNNFLNSLDGQKLFEQYSDIKKYIIDNSGSNFTSKKMADMYFTLTTEQENGLVLPAWTEKVYPKVLSDLTHLEYFLSTANTELKKLASGFLLKKIIYDSEQKIKNMLHQRKRMFIYSAHEYNIAHLMYLLGIYYPHVPPYGSYMLIEIHNIKGIRIVKVFYQDYRTEKPKRMKLPNCNNFCRFERFVNLYKKYLPESRNECELAD
ncbi:venom acid phosphatase Acph-1-like [Tribolium madens]|uniref:venom acid phosphatase Acph-1-like n=1 Tax=Tribolium madens TaxID=41895 RepID=UPI001CF74FD2|nr:venom acid phosphatase Acph-1-like [Tribolium madens]